MIKNNAFSTQKFNKPQNYDEYWIQNWADYSFSDDNDTLYLQLSTGIATYKKQ